jgi:hypothetical protein
MTSTKVVDENEDNSTTMCRHENDVCDDHVVRTSPSSEERISSLVNSNGNVVVLNNLKNESAEIFTIASSEDTLSTTIVNASSTFTSDLCSIANDISATSDIEVIAQ